MTLLNPPIRCPFCDAMMACSRALSYESDATYAVRTFICQPCRAILNVPCKFNTLAMTIGFDAIAMSNRHNRVAFHRLEKKSSRRYHDTMVTTASTSFRCRQCDADYELVRMAVPAERHEREIACLCCGAPLQGRQGDYVLKYFLVGRPTERQRRAPADVGSARN